MYRLVFIGGAFKGRRLAVQQGNVVIGRYPDCTVHLPEADVAPRHAVIEERADGIYVRALDPLFRVTVNETPVTDIRLNHGDQVDIGHTRILYQSIQGAPVTERRRRGKFQNVTMAAVALIIIFEIGLLASLFLYWRSDPLITTAAAEPSESLDWLESEVAGRRRAPQRVVEYPGIPPEWVIRQEDQATWAQNKTVESARGLDISSIRLSKADTLNHTLRVRMHQLNESLNPESIVVLASWFTRPDGGADEEPVLMATALQREIRQLEVEAATSTVWEALITVPVDVIFTEMGGIAVGYRLLVFAEAETQDQKFAPRRFWQASQRRVMETPAEPDSQPDVMPKELEPVAEPMEDQPAEEEGDEDDIVPVG